MTARSIKTRGKLARFCWFMLAFGLSGCGRSPHTSGALQAPVCDGVYALVAQEITAEYNVERSRSLASRLVAAAEADVAAIKQLKQAKADASVGAELGNTLKGVVQTKSAVTTDFFQQDQSFAQSACFIQSVLEEELSPGDREFFEDARRRLAANRVSYLDVLTGLKKN